MAHLPLPTVGRTEQILAAFAGQRIVVVGDMVADEYILGTASRISREAPVVILEFVERRLVPGGATNVAANLQALGATVQVIGVIGDDPAGRELLDVLLRLGIDTRGLIVAPERPTSTKTRIVGGGAQVVQQQMVRIDRIDSSPLHGRTKDAVLSAASNALDAAHGLILSDYEHGVIDPELIGMCLGHATPAGFITTVDAHGDLYRFRGVTLATPNQPEAEATLGRPMRDATELREGGRSLLDGMSAQGLLITRGRLGMAVLDRDGLYAELPAFQAAEVRDATGAGDTVAATATLALGAGAALPEAALLSSVAAGLVVRRFGAATVTTAEIARALDAIRNPGGGG